MLGKGITILSSQTSSMQIHGFISIPSKQIRRFLHDRGFALVVTLMLMILLTVLAVGLLTLSSIALRGPSCSTAMAQARQYAKLSLMLALNDLQKYAGPDQRITATADIAGDANGLRLAAGKPPLNDKSINNLSKGLSALHPGTRYWTGVFTNHDTPASIYTKTPSPTIVHWLVSDNTYPTSGPGILPSDATYAVGPDGKLSDATKGVLLAGANTVGTASNSMDGCVVAPLVEVVGKDSAKPVARFAWWVGDEGVKARINIDKTFEDKANYAALTAQRRGWETIDGFAAYPTASTDTHGELPKIITLPETVLLIPDVRNPGQGVSPLQNVFHSATTDSRAVLADTLNGGTKIDLSAILSGTLPASKTVATILNYPSKGTNIIPKSIASTLKAPLWDAIKEFSDRARSLESGSLIVKAATTDFTAAVAPVITDFRILMGARIKVKDAAAGTFNVNSCGKIAIVIANPYSCPLQWKNDLEIEVRNQTPTGNQPARIWPLGEGTAFIPGNPSEPAVFNNAFFRIKPSTLAPGEAQAYTLAGPVMRATGTGTQRVVIDLSLFDASSPFNFNNCVELENTASYDNLIMDVRESWQTTLAMVEMRLAGSASGQILRRIERFELDNGYFASNQRSFSKEEATALTQPFPLMLYSFQISQPGTDYKSLMPALYDMGQRGSTLRTFTDFNLQATRVRKPITSYNPPPYFMESNDSKSQLPATAPGGDTGTAFTRNLAVTPVRWGRSPTGSEKTILFSIPSQISSLAQLQHADLTGDDLAASICHQPGNAVGNSYATPFVKRGLLFQTRTDYELMGTPNGSGANQTSTKYYDISFLLNAALWDSYFFSTIPRTGIPKPDNPALIRCDSSASSNQLMDPVAAASHLMIDGAFNCNSTDKNAWKAFLASARHFKHAADTAEIAAAAFPRTLEQTSPSATPPTGNDADSFSGFLRLTDNQLDALAAEIVKQVRLRGPFVTLSHFVNRALADLKTQPALTRCGALQSAIDESGANINFAANKNAFSRIKVSEDAVTLMEKQGAPRADLDGTDLSDRPPDADTSNPDWAVTSTDNNFGAVASIIADREMLKDAKYKPEQGYRSTGIPGWLTQADVLQVIGPSLTTRSDTFRIRAYGEVLDSNGTPVARAYCEAIVQRVPAYTDLTNPPTARGAVLTTLNQTYGRHFQIIDFRWLFPQDI